jgi:hypothetical protein
MQNTFKEQLLSWASYIPFSNSDIISKNQIKLWKILSWTNKKSHLSSKLSTYYWIDKIEENNEKDKIYERFIYNQENIYWFLDYNDSFYIRLRIILDKVLKSAWVNPKDIKMDCILSGNSNACIFPLKNHIFIESWFFSNEISEDKIAWIFAHELWHHKYRKIRWTSENNLRKFIMNIEEERVADLEVLWIINWAWYNPIEYIDLFAHELKSENEEWLKWIISNVITTPHETSSRRFDYLTELFETQLFKNRDKEPVKIESQKLKSIADNRLALTEELLDVEDLEIYLWNMTSIESLLEIYSILFEEGSLTDKDKSILKSKFDELGQKSQLWKKYIDILWILYTSEKNISALFNLPKLSKESISKFSEELNDVEDMEEYVRDITSPDTILEIYFVLFKEWLLTKNDEKILKDKFCEIHASFDEEIEELWSLSISRLKSYNEDSDFSDTLLEKLSWINFTDFLKNIYLNHPKVLLNNKKIIDFILYFICENENAENYILEMYNFFSANSPDLSDYIIFSIDLMLLNYLLKFLLENDIELEDSIKVVILWKIIEKWEKYDNDYTLDFIKKYYSNKVLTKLESELIFKAFKSIIEDWGIIDIDLLNISLYLSLKNRIDLFSIRAFSLRNIDFFKNPNWILSFEWEEDNFQEAELNWVHLIVDNLSEIDENIFWLIIMIHNHDNISEGILKNIKPKLFARILLSMKEWNEKNNVINFILNHSSENDRDYIFNLVKLNEIWGEINCDNISERIWEIPEVPERNELLFKLLNEYSWDDKLWFFEILSPYFIKESKEELRNKLWIKINNWSILNEMLSSDSFFEFYNSNIIWKVTSTLDKICLVVWNDKKQKSSFSLLSFLEQLSIINSFFPENSIEKENIILSETNHDNNLSNLFLMLENLSYPIYRYMCWDIIWNQFKNEEWNLLEKLKLLEKAYPEASYYRDRVIDELLLASYTTFEQIKYIEENLLYRWNTINSNSSEYYEDSLLLTRLFWHVVYYSPSDEKNILYNRLVSYVESNESSLKYIEFSDKKEIFKSFFYWKKSLINSESFRNSLKNRRLKWIFSKEDIDKMRFKQDLSRLLDSIRWDWQEYIKKYWEKYSNEIMEKWETLRKAISKRDLSFFEWVVDFSLILPEITFKNSTEDWYNLEWIFLDIFKWSFLKDIYDLIWEPYDWKYSSDKDEYLIFIVLRRLKELLDENTFIMEEYLWAGERTMFAILDTLPSLKQSQVMSDFYSKIFWRTDLTWEDVVVIFLEAIWLPYIKTWQQLASLWGTLPKTLQEKLLKLTSWVDPINVFNVWHILWQEYWENISWINELWPLCSVASVRQSHYVIDQSWNKRILKFKLPRSVNQLEMLNWSLKSFVWKVKTNPRILSSVVDIPDWIVDDVIKSTHDEVVNIDDREKQHNFSEKHSWKKIWKYKLNIPQIDESLSTSIITVETIADWVTLSKSKNFKWKIDLVFFLLESILNSETDPYHADIHGWNIMINEEWKELSIIDFWITWNLSKRNSFLFFDLLKSIMSFDVNKITKNIIAIHFLELWESETLDIMILKQNIEDFIKNLNWNFDIESLSMNFLSIISTLNLKFPQELFKLIKTLSQFWYLLDWNEKSIFERLKTEWFKHLFKSTPREVAEKYKIAEKLLLDDEEVEKVFVFKKWTIIYDFTTWASKTSYFLDEDTKITREGLSEDEVFTIKVEWIRIWIIKWKESYKVRVWWRLVNLSDLLYSK